MEIKIRKNYLRLPYDSIANGALPPRLTSFLQLLMTILLGNSLRLRWNLQVQSLIFLSWVFLSTEKAYSSFPRLKNLELILFINTLLLHGLNPRPSLYNISAKNHLNCLKNLLFESLFLRVFVAIFGCGNIFDQRLLFDHKQLCIWPLELSEHYEPGITVKPSFLNHCETGWM